MSKATPFLNDIPVGTKVVLVSAFGKKPNVDWYESANGKVGHVRVYENGTRYVSVLGYADVQVFAVKVVEND